MTDSDSETLPEVGGMSLSMFLDELNPLSKEIHPALPTVIEEKRADNAMRGTVTLYRLKLLTPHGRGSDGLISSCCRRAGQTEGGAVRPPHQHQADPPQAGETGGAGQDARYTGHALQR